ncbi:MAG: hypothetical protein IIC50_12835 [Planctomycetes bacterium]|nr:hypothetical protein [Planctomycetota bacterium]
MLCGIAGWVNFPGGCAAAAATQKLGLVDSPVTVRMPGGALRIDLEEEGHVFLTGPVEYVFEGEIASFP